MITLDSKVKEVYAHPVGHDIIRRVLLQLGMGSAVIENPVVGNMNLKQLQKKLQNNQKMGITLMKKKNLDLNMK